MNVDLYSGFVSQVVGAGEEVKKFWLPNCTVKKLLPSDILIKIYWETSKGKDFLSTQLLYCETAQH